MLTNFNSHKFGPQAANLNNPKQKSNGAQFILIVNISQ